MHFVESPSVFISFYWMSMLWRKVYLVRSLTEYPSDRSKGKTELKSAYMDMHFLLEICLDEHIERKKARKIY